MKTGYATAVFSQPVPAKVIASCFLQVAEEFGCNVTVVEIEVERPVKKTLLAVYQDDGHEEIYRIALHVRADSFDLLDTSVSYASVAVASSRSVECSAKNHGSLLAAFATSLENRVKSRLS